MFISEFLACFDFGMFEFGLVKLRRSSFFLITNLVCVGVTLLRGAPVYFSRKLRQLGVKLGKCNSTLGNFVAVKTV